MITVIIRAAPVGCSGSRRGQYPAVITDIRRRQWPRLCTRGQDRPVGPVAVRRAAYTLIQEIGDFPGISELGIVTDRHPGPGGHAGAHRHTNNPKSRLLPRLLRATIPKTTNHRLSQ